MGCNSYCPKLHDPNNVTVDNLPWAYPVSAMGGIDDSGLSWIPPAGSYIMLAFENGDREALTTLELYGLDNEAQTVSPFTPADPFAPNAIPEYQRFFAGTRGGYIVGPDDESQVLPPFNTDQYHGFDPTSLSEITQATTTETDTIAHQYGYKTPQKHYFRADDGDPKCNYRWKRMEWQSSTGHYMVFKDNHLHYCGEWSNPFCATGENTSEQGEIDSGEPDYPVDQYEDSSQDGTVLCPNSTELATCPGAPGVTSDVIDTSSSEESEGTSSGSEDQSTILFNLTGTPSSCCGVSCSNTGVTSISSNNKSAFHSSIMDVACPNQAFNGCQGLVIPSSWMKVQKSQGVFQTGKWVYNHLTSMVALAFIKEEPSGNQQPGIALN